MLFLIVILQGLAIPGFASFCNNYLCQTCFFEYADQNYTQSLIISIANSDTITNSQCVLKNTTILSRKVFVQNSTNLILQNNIKYDLCYPNIAKAFEGESKIFNQYLQGSLLILLESGTHILKETDFENANEQLFRRMLINITISPEHSETVKIVLKTNKFYLFFSSFALITNLSFIGNDINWLNFSDPCYNDLNILCCQHLNLDYDTTQNSKKPCSILNYPLNHSSKNNYYGMFNIENVADNNFGIQPNFQIKNCEFANFFVFNNDGFSSLFAMAPLSGILAIESVHIYNSLFPLGVVYHFMKQYDTMYTIYFQNLDNFGKINSLEKAVLINNFTLVSYNFLPVKGDFNFIIFGFQDFNGSFVCSNSHFEQISHISAMFYDVNADSFLINYVNFTNITQSKLFALSEIQNVSLSNIKISFLNNHDSLSLINFETISNVLLIALNLTAFQVDFSTVCFQILNSNFTIRDSFISGGLFNSLITQEGENLFVKNVSFVNLTFLDNLISYSGFQGYSIEQSCFSNINGITYLFVLFKSSFLKIKDSILEMIKIYAIFYIVDSNLNLIESNLIRNNYFKYLWEVDTTCDNVINNLSNLYNNTVAISFYRDLSIPNNLFMLYQTYIHDNSFIQLNSGGMVQMQLGICIYDHTNFMDNYFLNFNKFQYLFEYDIDCHLTVKSCFFKDNGVLTKKKNYFTYNDNNIFYLWSVVYTHYNDTVFMITDKVEMLGGIISAAPHGGSFEFLNCILILEIINNSATGFEYKGIQLDHFITASLINNTFYNLLCNDKSFATQYGGISLLASTSYTYSKGQNNYWLFMKNNSFFNSTCINGGGLSIVGIQTVLVEDCKFYKSRTHNRGGAFIVVGSENCTINNMFINDSQAVEGGAMYIQNIFSLSLNNITIQNVFTLGSGGIYVKGIAALVFQNLITNNTFSEIKSGVFLIYRSNLTLNLVNISNSRAKLEGGTLISDDRSEILISNIFIENSSSQIAGVFSVASSTSFNLYNVIIKDSFSYLDGGVFLLTSYSTSYLKNIEIYDSVSVGGMGVIYIHNGDDQSQIKIENLNCQNVSALDGSCILFFSASELILENINIYKAMNNPLSLIGLITVSVSLFKLNISLCSSLKNVVYLSNIELQASLLFISNNFATSDVFFTDSVELSLSQAKLFYNSEFRIFSFTNSNVSMEYVEAMSQNVLYMNALSTDIFLDSVLLFSGNCSKDSNLIFLGQTNLTSLNCSFTKNKGLLFYFFNCPRISINKGFFSNNSNLSPGKPNEISISNEGGFFTELIISESNFEIFQGFSILILGNLKTEIHSSIFQNLQPQINSITALSIAPSKNILLENSYFFNFTESAILISNQIQFSQNDVSFKNCVFGSNRASKGSAIYIEGDYNILVDNCLFDSNFAFISEENKNSLTGVGPSIFFKPNSRDSSTFIVFSTIFKNNSASYIAPTIFSQNPIQILNSTFIDNSDAQNFSEETFSLPLKLIFSKNVSKELQNQIDISFNSGEQFMIEFLLQDNSNQTLTFDNQSILTIKQSKVQNFSIILGSTLSRCQSGKVIFMNLLIKVMPNSTFPLDVSGVFSGITKDLLPQQFFQTLTFHSRSCMIGEIIQNDFSCVKCPEHTYSLQNPMQVELKYQKCAKCPENADCHGGNIITPVSGFYRYSGSSVKVVACLSELSCIGDRNDSTCNEACLKNITVYGGCLNGNSGPLCSICDEFYGRSDKNEPCYQCADLSTLIIGRCVGYIVLMCLYLLFNSYFAEKTSSKGNFNSNIGVYGKVLINHTQQVTLILLNTSFPFANIRKMLNVVDFISFTNDQVVNNECLLSRIYSQTTQPAMLKVIINSILPMALSLLAFFIWFLYFACFSRQRKYASLQMIFSKLSLFLVLSVFMFYPLIIKSCFGMFDCMKLDPDLEITFLKINLELQCWSKTHIGFIFAFALPGILVWGIGFPLFLNFQLKKQGRTIVSGQYISPEGASQRKQNKKTINPFLFFFKGYNDRNCYWESLIMLRKFLLCLISTLNDSIIDEYKWFLILIIMGYFLSITIKRMPFSKREANNSEIGSLITCIFSAFTCFAVNSNAYFDFKILLSFISIGLNIIFYVYSVFILSNELRKNMNAIRGSLTAKNLTMSMSIKKNKITLAVSKRRVKQVWR